MCTVHYTSLSEAILATVLPILIAQPHHGGKQADERLVMPDQIPNNGSTRRPRATTRRGWRRSKPTLPGPQPYFQTTKAERRFFRVPPLRTSGHALGRPIFVRENPSRALHGE